MGKFREWLREAEGKETIKEETEYQKFFAKKLEKFGKMSLSPFFFIYFWPN